MSSVPGPKRLSDIKTMYWKGLIYGGPGNGKTVFASTSQKFRTFIFDVDNGLNSANAFLTKNKLTKDLVTFWPVETTKDFFDAFDYLERNEKEYDLVVVDSMTELQRLLMREIMEAAKHKQADQRDWGAILQAMESITSRFRSMPVNLVLIAHEVSKTNEETATEVWQPSFQGAYRAEFAKHLSFIGRLQMFNRVEEKDGKKEVRVIRALNFGPDTTSIAKDRSGSLERWEQPDLDAIFAKLAASTVSNDSE